MIQSVEKEGLSQTANWFKAKRRDDCITALGEATSNSSGSLAGGTLVKSGCLLTLILSYSFHHHASTLFTCPSRAAVARQVQGQIKAGCIPTKRGLSVCITCTQRHSQHPRVYLRNRDQYLLHASHTGGTWLKYKFKKPTSLLVRFLCLSPF